MDRKDEFGELGQLCRRLHNPPPPVPRERMWERIRQAGVVVSPAPARLQRPHPWPWTGLRLAAAAAFVLIVGIGIGRLALPGRRTADIPSAQVPAPSASATAALSIPHERSLPIDPLAAGLYNRAEVLLTDLKSGSCGALDRGGLQIWAASLLLQTRILLDDARRGDPGERALLMDLELTLAQIAGMSRTDCARDLDWIRTGMKERATLDRLRALASASPRRLAL